MAKFNYGPRFNGGSITGRPVGYSPDQDPFTWKGTYNPSRFKADPLSRHLAIGKAQGNSKVAKARVGKLPNGDPPQLKPKSRAEYEKEMAVLITEVVARLEAGLAELNLAPALSPYERIGFSRPRIMKAIHELRMSFNEAKRGIR